MLSNLREERGLFFSAVGLTRLHMALRLTKGVSATAEADTP